jgi:hypothetical protein
LQFALKLAEYEVEGKSTFAWWLDVAVHGS